MRDPLVAEVQAILVQRDLYHHRHHNQVDGIYGEETRHAVEDFQREAGLPVTGSLDTRTLRALGVAVGGSETAIAKPQKAAPPPSSAPITPKTKSNVPSPSNPVPVPPVPEEDQAVPESKSNAPSPSNPVPVPPVPEEDQVAPDPLPVKHKQVADFSFSKATKKQVAADDAQDLQQNQVAASK